MLPRITFHNLRDVMSVRQKVWLHNGLLFLAPGRQKKFFVQMYRQRFHDVV